MIGTAVQIPRNSHSLVSRLDLGALLEEVYSYSICKCSGPVGMDDMVSPIDGSIAIKWVIPKSFLETLIGIAKSELKYIK